MIPFDCSWAEPYQLPPVDSWPFWAIYYRYSQPMTGISFFCPPHHSKDSKILLPFLDFKLIKILTLFMTTGSISLVSEPSSLFGRSDLKIIRSIIFPFTLEVVPAEDDFPLANAPQHCIHQWIPLSLSHKSAMEGRGRLFLFPHVLIPPSLYRSGCLWSF